MWPSVIPSAWTRWLWCWLWSDEWHAIITLGRKCWPPSLACSHLVRWPMFPLLTWTPWSGCCLIQSRVPLCPLTSDWPLDQGVGTKNKSVGESERRVLITWATSLVSKSLPNWQYFSADNNNAWSMPSTAYQVIPFLQTTWSGSISRWPRVN